MPDAAGKQWRPGRSRCCAGTGLAGAVWRAIAHNRFLAHLQVDAGRVDELASEPSNIPEDPNAEE